MRIIRNPSLNETQFFGCVAAFVDALSGELNAASIALRRLQGQAKGHAFAYEMELDQRRYGALIVVDRWSTLTGTFGPHLELTRRESILTDAAARARSAEEILARTNDLLDKSGDYGQAVVEAALLGWQSALRVFDEERSEVQQSAKLGPLLPEEYREARRVFREDLAGR